MKFESFHLQKELLQGVCEMGFEEASPIQEQTIPYGLEGRDVLGQAQTGTGKTAAFGLPLLQKLDLAKEGVQALVLSPTRELAIQTGRELYRLGHLKGIRVVTVYGGADIRRQIFQLKKGTQVVVGTPGRLLDLMSRKVLKLGSVETLVLDEADEMLNMGFIADIEKIIAATPTERQTLLFSATMPKAIQSIGKHFMKEPVTVKIAAKEVTATTIDQYFTKCKESEKFDVLTRFIDVNRAKRAIIFARTKRRVDEIAHGLLECGYQAAGIHGDLSQEKRSDVIKMFKEGTLELLVATDVAARGLDISDVTHVYNYDIPQDPESYVHRIGRTGRAGNEGMSITFVTSYEMGFLRTIENLTRKKMSPLRPPTAQEAFSGQMKQSIDKIRILMERNDEEDCQEVVDYLMGNYTAGQLAFALVRSQMKPTRKRKNPVSVERGQRGSKHSRSGEKRKRLENKKDHSSRRHGERGSKRTGRNERPHQRKTHSKKEKVNTSFTIR